MSNNTPSPLELVRRHNLNLKKSLGQNLLVDTSHLARIAAAANLNGTDTVLEIGPGLGALTQYLAQQAGRVIGVELDQRFIPILREQFAGQSRVSFIHGDILELNFPDLIRMPKHSHTDTASDTPPYKVVANLPYYITSAVIRRLLEATPPPTLAVLLVQREVAQRITAQPGDMSLLAVSVQFYARPRALHTIPAGSFLPRPKVDSTLLHLEIRPQPAVPDIDPAHFFRIVRAGFGQRRKQLRNSLSAGLSSSKEEVGRWLSTAEIDAQRRAETLSLHEWGILAKIVPRQSGTNLRRSSPSA